eukprot:m.30049 g.30049  ORF g.30049 m.30049 type:complete len:67 (-) comp6749_c0_seq2:1014-1214(-)
MVKQATPHECSSCQEQRVEPSGWPTQSQHHTRAGRDRKARFTSHPTIAAFGALGEQIPRAAESDSE